MKGEMDDSVWNWAMGRANHSYRLESDSDVVVKAGRQSSPDLIERPVPNVLKQTASVLLPWLRQYPRMKVNYNCKEGFRLWTAMKQIRTLPPLIYWRIICQLLIRDESMINYDWPLAIEAAFLTERLLREDPADLPLVGVS